MLVRLNGVWNFGRVWQPVEQYDQIFNFRYLHYKKDNLLILYNRMAEFYGNIERMTTTNLKYRRVLGTATGMQLVVMRLKPLEEIGREVHPTTTQFIRIESGRAKCVIGEKEYILDDDEAIIIPANNHHNVINMSETNDLMLYTIYSERVHDVKCVQEKKEDAEC